MNIVQIIEKKKNNLSLNNDEIKYFIDNYTNSTIPDYQASALLMAICINGMNSQETIALTKSMMETGEVISYDLNKTVVDKHSTGGVGDKTSLVLVPLLASLGFAVSKMSGRGLGYTGGTIDKLSAIEGFDSNISEEKLAKQVNSIGCAIVAQTNQFVPGDKKIYALRDVTATVESLPLIASSIMSKKLALGSDIIILDVKYGKGAFMHSFEDAKALAKQMCDIGNGLNKKTIACISSMNQPLGITVGNSLEVKEAVDTLVGQTTGELRELCVDLACQFLICDDPIIDLAKAKEMVEAKIDDKSAYNLFSQMVQMQGARACALDNLPKSKYTHKLKANKSGYLETLDARLIGDSAILIGGGRVEKEDEIDLAVGFEIHKKVGDSVVVGDLLITIHYNQENKLSEVISKLEQAYSVSEEIIEKEALIEDIIK